MLSMGAQPDAARMTTTATPTRSPVHPVRVSDGERDAIARVLARAFEHDPVSAYCFPDDRDRYERLEQFYRHLFLPRMALPHEETYADEGLRGVAAWIPPGEGRTSAMEDRKSVV